MKAKRFSEEQIIAVLKESEVGAKTKDLCRRHGISEATYNNWKVKYAGMTVSEASSVCWPTLSLARQREGTAGPKMVSPHAKREAVTVLMTEWSFGVTRACWPLTIVDDCTRECLAIEVDTSITGTCLKAVL